MDKIIIAVGTTSKQKIDYLNEVIKEIGLCADLIPINVKSNISNQPLTKEETILGSLNRAKSVLKENQKADIGLGIEVGYHREKEDYKIFCCTTIIDNKNKVVSACSHFFNLPSYHQEKLNSGKYLGDNLDSYLKEGDQKIKKYIADMIRYRKPFIYEACRSVLLEYFKDL